jgi:hypothetical protein
MRHNPGYGIMASLVERGAVPVDGLNIGLWRWDLYEIAPRIVERPVSTDTEIHAGGPDQRFGLRQDEVGLDRRFDRSDSLGQTLALCCVEDGEALEERDRLRFLAGLRSASAFVLRREAVGIDDRRTALALPDIATEAEGLAKSQPAVAGEAALNDGAPEKQHIDSRIATIGGCILRHGERRFRRGRSPWLDPGHAPRLQLGDDLVSDFLVEARPILAGASG